MKIALNTLRDNPGAQHSRKRVGRGVGSGLGKTCGHGQKGQKARTGVAIKAFEGGQMPLQMRLPKRGFKRGFVRGEKPVCLNVGMIQKAIDHKKIEAGCLLTSDILVQAGLLRRPSTRIRLLAKGDLTSALKIEVMYASASAVRAVEQAGGSVIIQGAISAQDLGA